MNVLNVSFIVHFFLDKYNFRLDTFLTYVVFNIQVHKTGMRGNLYGVVVNVLDCNIVVSEFELQSHCYIHFQINTLGKVMNSLILTMVKYGLKRTTTVLLYGRLWGPTRVNMPLNHFKVTWYSIHSFTIFTFLFTSLVCFCFFFIDSFTDYFLCVWKWGSIRAPILFFYKNRFGIK